jgi:uncharacterized membrane protein
MNTARPRQHRSSWFLHFRSCFVALMLICNGCTNNGLRSSIPLLEEDQGDEFSAGAGFWYVKYTEIDNSVFEFVVLIEDQTSGMIFKDYTYKLTFLALASPGSTSLDLLSMRTKMATATRILRVRKGKSGYSMQFCKEQSSSNECLLGYGRFGAENKSLELFQTTSVNLTSRVAEALGGEFLIAKDKNKFTIPSAVASQSGDLIMNSLASSFEETGFSPTGPVSATRITREVALNFIESFEKREKRVVQEEAAREQQHKKEAEVATYGLEICNGGPEDASMAVGVQDKESWETHGWFPLNAGACTKLLKGVAIGGSKFYIRAEGVRGSIWGDKFNLCINPREKFQAIGFQDCEKRGLQTATFLEIDVPAGMNQYRKELTGGKPPKIDGLAIGDGVFVSGFLEDEAAMIVDIDKNQGKVKVRRAGDGTTTWVDQSKIITREESQVNNVGRVGGAMLVLYCLANPKDCSDK